MLRQLLQRYVRTYTDNDRTYNYTKCVSQYDDESEEKIKGGKQKRGGKKMINLRIIFLLLFLMRPSCCCCCCISRSSSESTSIVSCSSQRNTIQQTNSQPASQPASRPTNSQEQAVCFLFILDVDCLLPHSCFLLLPWLVGGGSSCSWLGFQTIHLKVHSSSSTICLN